MDGARVVGDVAGAWFESGPAAQSLGGGSASHAAHDPGQVDDVGEVSDLPGTVPPFGYEQVEMVGAEVDGDVAGEFGRGFVFVMEEEGDIDGSVLEQGHGFGWFRLGDFVGVVLRGVRSGVGLEPAQCSGEGTDDEAGESGQSDVASAEAEGFREISAQSRHRGGHLGGADAGELASGGQPDAAGRAVEEGDSEVFLQRRHVLGQGWLGPAEVAGGGSDAAGFGDGAEDEEAFRLTGVESLLEEIGHKPSLCQSSGIWVYRRSMMRTTLEVIVVKSSLS
ncbi:Uncharacterised protein [Brevibacterium iodinum]|nr:Uncharacterised protein [Brevibacterium iodinum]